MGWRVVSLVFLLIAIVALPFWPYRHPWPSYASLAICGFCFFVAGLTFLLSIFARHGSSLWQGRGKG